MEALAFRERTLLLALYFTKTELARLPKEPIKDFNLLDGITLKPTEFKLGVRYSEIEINITSSGIDVEEQKDAIERFTRYVVVLDKRIYASLEKNELFVGATKKGTDYRRIGVRVYRNKELFDKFVDSKRKERIDKNPLFYQLLYRSLASS